MSRLTLNSSNGFGGTKGKHGERFLHAMHIPRDGSLWESLVPTVLCMTKHAILQRQWLWPCEISGFLLSFPLVHNFFQRQYNSYSKALLLNMMLNGSLLSIQDAESTLSGHEATHAIYQKCPLTAYWIFFLHSTICLIRLDSTYLEKKEYQLPRSMSLSKSSNTAFPFPFLPPRC